MSPRSIFCSHYSTEYKKNGRTKTTVFLSQFSKIVPIKTAYLRYAVCGCCLCIKNANCYRKKRHQFASSKTSVSSTVCPLGMWYFTAGRWTLVKYRLVLGSQPMTTASPLPRTAQHRVSQWASAVSFSAHWARQNRSHRLRSRNCCQFHGGGGGRWPWE